MLRYTLNKVMKTTAAMVNNCRSSITRRVHRLGPIRTSDRSWLGIHLHGCEVPACSYNPIIIIPLISEDTILDPYINLLTAVPGLFWSVRHGRTKAVFSAPWVDWGKKRSSCILLLWNIRYVHAYHVFIYRNNLGYVPPVHFCLLGYPILQASRYPSKCFEMHSQLCAAYHHRRPPGVSKAAYPHETPVTWKGLQ